MTPLEKALAAASATLQKSRGDAKRDRTAETQRRRDVEAVARTSPEKVSPGDHAQLRTPNAPPRPEPITKDRSPLANMVRGHSPAPAPKPGERNGPVQVTSPQGVTAPMQKPVRPQSSTIQPSPGHLQQSTFVPKPRHPINTVIDAIDKYVSSGSHHPDRGQALSLALKEASGRHFPGVHLRVASAEGGVALHHNAGVMQRDAMGKSQTPHILQLPRGTDYGLQLKQHIDRIRMGSEPGQGSVGATGGANLPTISPRERPSLTMAGSGGRAGTPASSGKGGTGVRGGQRFAPPRVGSSQYRIGSYPPNPPRGGPPKQQGEVQQAARMSRSEGLTTQAPTRDRTGQNG